MENPTEPNIAHLFRTQEWSSFTKHKNFSDEEIIYHEDAPAESLFYIESGIVKLQTYLPNGQARVVRLHKSGELIGLDEIMEPTYRQTAISVNNVSLMQVSLERIRTLEKLNPEGYLQLLKESQRHLALADTWIAEFSTGSIKARVARLITFLAQLEFGESSDNVALLKIDEMANILGVTPESTSRIMADFKRNRILERATDAETDLYRINHNRLSKMITD